MSAHAYTDGLTRCEANHVPLSPIGFLDRAAIVHPDRVAIVHGGFRQTWQKTRERCYALASALQRRGIKPLDTVSIIAPNTPAVLECHYGVPLAGAVLNAINHRLDAEGIAFILRHGESRLVFVDREFAGVVAEALKLLDNPPDVIDINDHLAPSGDAIGDTDYESFIASGEVSFAGHVIEDEWTPIALNYTSGTTGDPKGVVASHRGTYLMSLLQLTNWSVGRAPKYLWTLPMFHANGWCFTWAITASAGTHVCLRKVTADLVFDAIAEYDVDHFCAAPIVLSMIANSSARRLSHPVRVLTAGSPPPAAVLSKVQAIGFEVDHVYGITEVSGTPIGCEWQDGWSEQPVEQQARLRVRQGARAAMFEAVAVADPDTVRPVPHDGKTSGELLMRGNTVMMGYLKNPDGTRKAFARGWFHTGDIAVVHDDGYLQIVDRSKDVIISGGENISSIEVEDVIHTHPAVLHAAVVAQPDDKWGEVPCAFVELLPDAVDVSEAAIIAFCRERLAHYKCPRRIIFSELPKTATGKIQKFQLRSEAGSRDAITRLASS